MKRVTKTEWLEKALEILSEKGIESVKIEVLAKNLNTSRSGFYWHFKNREELLKEMLNYWSREFTQVGTKNPRFIELEPKQRLKETMKLINDYDLAKYEIAIRSWAQNDPMAKKAVKTVYRERMDFIRNIFYELGFKGDELEMRTTLFVCYHIWESSMLYNYPKKEVDKLIELRHKFFTQNI